MGGIIGNVRRAVLYHGRGRSRGPTLVQTKTVSGTHLNNTMEARRLDWTRPNPASCYHYRHDSRGAGVLSTVETHNLALAQQIRPIRRAKTKPVTIVFCVNKKRKKQFCLFERHRSKTRRYYYRTDAGGTPRRKQRDVLK